MSGAPVPNAPLTLPLSAHALDAFDSMRQFMTQSFPPLWPVMEGCLCACGTLLLRHRPAPITVILVGASGSGKGTTLDMITKCDSDMIVSVDDLSTASFLSQAEKRSGDSVLTTIKHKILVTSDMGSILRGKDDKAAEKHFARIARVLDGSGLTTGGGYHGIQGLVGDYLFIWLGATTPLTDVDYRAMSAIGQRLFFLRMPYDGTSDLTPEEVFAASGYNRKTEIGRRIMSALFKEVFPSTTVARSISWNEKADPPEVLEQVREYVNLLSITRAEHGHEREKGFRAYNGMADMMRARAMWHGRSQVTEEDLVLARRLTLGSMRPMWMFLLKELGAAADVGLTVEEVTLSTGLSLYKARKLMTDATRYGLADTFEAHRTIVMNGNTQPTRAAGAIRLTPRWRKVLSLF